MNFKITQKSCCYENYFDILYFLKGADLLLMFTSSNQFMIYTAKCLLF